MAPSPQSNDEVSKIIKENSIYAEKSPQFLFMKIRDLMKLKLTHIVSRMKQAIVGMVEVFKMIKGRIENATYLIANQS